MHRSAGGVMGYRHMIEVPNSLGGNQTLKYFDQLRHILGGGLKQQFIVDLAVLMRQNISLPD